MKLFIVIVVVLASAGVQAHAEEYSSPEVRAMVRLYDDCQRAEGGVANCFKRKAITFIDRMTGFDAISMGEGVRVVRNANANQSQDLLPKLQTDADIERSLPRGLDSGRADEALTNLLVERIARFFNTRSLTVNFPTVSSTEIARSVEEGRGKMKKMMSMMMMGMAMKMAAMVPMAIAGLYVLAGKALIVSKIALLLAGIMALKKLLAQKQSGGGGSSAGWSSGGGSGGWSNGGGGGGGGSGGWDKRSFEAAQDVAYQAYLPQQ